MFAGLHLELWLVSVRVHITANAVTIRLNLQGKLNIDEGPTRKQLHTEH